MKSFKQLLIEAINKEFLYHGTGEGAFRQIREKGLKCSGGKVYFSELEQYALSYSKRKGIPFGPRMLRVRWTDDFKKDENMQFKGDYISYTDIPPEQIELKVGNKWIPIQDYYDEDINIMPITK